MTSLKDKNTGYLIITKYVKQQRQWNMLNNSFVYCIIFEPFSNLQSRGHPPTWTSAQTSEGFLSPGDSSWADQISTLDSGSVESGSTPSDKDVGNPWTSLERLWPLVLYLPLFLLSEATENSLAEVEFELSTRRNLKGRHIMELTTTCLSSAI